MFNKKRKWPIDFALFLGISESSESFSFDLPNSSKFALFFRVWQNETPSLRFIFFNVILFIFLFLFYFFSWLLKQLISYCMCNLLNKSKKTKERERERETQMSWFICSCHMFDFVVCVCVCVRKRQVQLRNRFDAHRTKATFAVAASV